MCSISVNKGAKGSSPFIVISVTNLDSKGDMWSGEVWIRPTPADLRAAADELEAFLSVRAKEEMQKQEASCGTN